MVYTSDNFFDWIFGLINNVNMFQDGTNYLAVLLIVFVSAILISPRKMSNVKVLALPLMVGYSVVGLKVPLLFMVLAGIVFVMEILTTKGLGEVIETVSQKTTEIISMPEAIRERRRSNVEKSISTAKRESAIREAEKSKVIPFRRGTSISDVLDIMAESERKKILRLKSQPKRDQAIERYLKKIKDKEKYWEVDE